jgi:hypothetical protein
MLRANRKTSSKVTGMESPVARRKADDSYRG